MKKFLSNLFTADNLLFGNAVMLLALAFWTLSWKVVFLLLPGVLLITFVLGGAVQSIYNKFFKH